MMVSHWWDPPEIVQGFVGNILRAALVGVGFLLLAYFAFLFSSAVAAGARADAWAIGAVVVLASAGAGAFRCCSKRR